VISQLTQQITTLCSVRDIVEKKVILKVKNSKGVTETLIFSSSVPDDLYPYESGVVRATNLFCILKLTPLKDGRTKYSSYAQADPNFWFNLFSIFKSFVGSKIQEWYDSVTGHMDECMKLGIQP